MKISNVLVYVVAALLSGLLLWLWYYLGFSTVDGPVDVLIAIVWWGLIMAAIAGVMLVEETRKAKIRTVYVGENFVFNSETGCLPVEGASVDAIEAVLQGLTYDFSRVEVDPVTKSAICAVVRTKAYAAPEEEGEEAFWMGEVVAAVPGSTAVPFASKAELASLLADF